MGCAQEIWTRYGAKCCASIGAVKLMFWRRLFDLSCLMNKTGFMEHIKESERRTKYVKSITFHDSFSITLQMTKLGIWLQHSFNPPFTFSVSRLLRELPPLGRWASHTAEESPSAEPRGGTRAGPAVSALLLPAAGRGAGQSEGPAQGQRPGRGAAVVTEGRPGAPVEGRAHHPAPKPQGVSGTVE